MSAPFVPALDTFVGGQMTDLPAYTGGFDATALFEIVSPGSPATAVNYSITMQLLAQLIATFPITTGTVYISNGQFTNPASPYIPPAGTARIYIQKTVASPTYIQFATASTYLFEPIVADIGGVVDSAGNGVTVTFTGQLADGLSTVLITTPYGGYIFRPTPGAATPGWHLGVA